MGVWVMLNVHKGTVQYKEKLKQIRGRGGALFEPKTRSRYLKKK